MAKQADPNWISPSYQRKINPPPTQRELEWAEQARETAEYIRQIRTGEYEKLANIYTEDEVSMSDTHFDRTHELIDELARLDRTEFYTRLTEAAKELGWKEDRVEDCVRDRRRTLRDEAKRAATRHRLLWTKINHLIVSRSQPISVMRLLFPQKDNVKRGILK